MSKKRGRDLWVQSRTRWRLRRLVQVGGRACIPALARRRPLSLDPERVEPVSSNPEAREAFETRADKQFSGIFGWEVCCGRSCLTEEAVVGRDSEPNVAGAGFQRHCQASGRWSGRERRGPDVRALRSDPLILRLLWGTLCGQWVSGRLGCGMGVPPCLCPLLSLVFFHHIASGSAPGRQLSAADHLALCCRYPGPKEAGANCRATCFFNLKCNF